ncbi:HNH endonuclease [Massilia sp. RP-1-19]|uniref:HNH endonuclease n=1 Tax=Massilia polaris TaxID=2728846 RepID=A0A848HKA6_9BURK|nr:HNH endonuclease [Massilia polaris]NML61835.1 HNH endonuclease [Massilia polaris]
MNQKIPLITAGRLRELFIYDEATGFFIWRKTCGARAKAGAIAGHKSSREYIQMRLDGRNYKGHRLAWLYVHGEWPSDQIDHINGVKSDNRIANLRDVSCNINHQNLRQACVRSSTGLLGVIPDKNRWRARIDANKKTYRLGSFNSPELAHAAYIEAKRRLHEGCTI